MTKEASAEAAPAAKKKSKKGLLIGVVGLLVVGGGGGAYWFTRPTAEAAAEEHAAPEHEGESVVSFEPFVVNLADGGGTRYLRASVQIVLAGAETGAEVNEDPVKMVRLRSEVLGLLTEQTSDMLMTVEGKDALKQAINARAAESLAPHMVLDVLFSDFIVQR